ncbi:MAG TPA: TonB-dependent receptor [Holophagaceae bacterium]|nr:TonB-dependent receptor [Holophagaceae bacterium]
MKATFAARHGRPVRALRGGALALGLVAACGLPLPAQDVKTASLFDRSLDELMDLRITTTARKREERLQEIPVSVTTFTEQEIRNLDLRTFTDFAGLTPNMAFAYGNGFTVGNPSTGISTSRSVGLRGVAGARTTGFYVDDTPLPSSIDVRLLDLSRVEVLKGPQGTLYGEGSLGGSVRMITHPPDLERSGWRGQVEAGVTEDGGSLNRGAEGVGNLVLAKGRAALRLAVSGSRSAGWLTRDYPSDINDPGSRRVEVDDQGAQRAFAGALSGLFRVTEALDVSVKFLYQELHDNGFPAGWAPLPDFRPEPTLTRLANLQPRADDAWTLPSVTITYQGKGWALTSATSFFNRRTRDEEDSSEATIQLYNGAYPPQPFLWTGRSTTEQVAHETRVSLGGSGALSATLGVFLARYRTRYAILPRTEQSTGDLLWKEDETNTQKDKALFGEVYWKVQPELTLTLGARQYWLDQDDIHTVLLGAVDDTIRGSDGSRGISPKVALAWQPREDSLVYLSASKGFRQGNVQIDPGLLGAGPELAAHGQTSTSFLRVRPDSLWSYEAGTKLFFPGPGLQLTGSLFHIDVKNFQQQVLLKSIGLLLQGNAGAAEINGGEVELSGRPTPDLSFRMGVGYESARITRPGNTFQAEGDRIYHVPRWTASLGGYYSRPLAGELKGFVGLTCSHTGASLSGNTGTDQERPAYTLVDLRAGVSRAAWEVALSVKNAGGARPNLGDLTYVGYGLYTDATRTSPIPQVATLPSRTWMLQFSTRF